MTTNKFTLVLNYSQLKWENEERKKKERRDKGKGKIEKVRRGKEVAGRKQGEGGNERDEE